MDWLSAQEKFTGGGESCHKLTKQWEIQFWPQTDRQKTSARVELPFAAKNSTRHFQNMLCWRHLTLFHTLIRTQSRKLSPHVNWITFPCHAQYDMIFMTTFYMHFKFNYKEWVKKNYGIFHKGGGESLLIWDQFPYFFFYF